MNFLLQMPERSLENVKLIMFLSCWNSSNDSPQPSQLSSSSFQQQRHLGDPVPATSAASGPASVQVCWDSLHSITSALPPSAWSAPAQNCRAPWHLSLRSYLVCKAATTELSALDMPPPCFSTSAGAHHPVWQPLCHLSLSSTILKLLEVLYHGLWNLHVV